MDDESARRRDAAMLGAVDEVFARVRSEYPGALPCSEGCSGCCAAFFQITSLDAWRLRRGIGNLPAATRDEIAIRAEALLERVRDVDPAWSEPWDIRAIGTAAFRALGHTIRGVCPALGDRGECLVYESRPRICHLQGLSYRDPKRGAELPDFCADDFGSEAYSKIPPQPLDLAAQWSEEASLRQEVAAEMPESMQGGYTTFVAALFGMLK